MTIDEIHAAIPHRPPMLLVDEIVERTGDAIVCRKTFRDDEFFLQGHYPGRPIVPGVILCECALQSGAILLADRLPQGGGVPVATRLNDVKFKKMIGPGDTIAIEVTLNERLADAFYLTAKIRCREQLAARLDFACTLGE